jgi:hypothetical protein
MTPPKFPRRYAQHQVLALCHDHAITPPETSSSHKRFPAQKPPSKKSRKASAANSNIASAIDPYPSSSSLPDDESDSDYESDPDSGYSSSSSDAKAEYYRQMRAQFTAEGPIMADLSDASKAMMKT